MYMKMTIEKIKTYVESVGLAGEVEVLDAEEYFECQNPNDWEAMCKEQMSVEGEMINGVHMLYPYTIDNLPMVKGKSSYKKVIAQLYKSYDYCILVHQVLGKAYFIFGEERGTKIVKEHKPHKPKVGSVRWQTVCGLMEVRNKRAAKWDEEHADREGFRFIGVPVEPFFEKYIFNRWAWNDCYPRFHEKKARHKFNEVVRELIDSELIKPVEDQPVFSYIFPTEDGGKTEPIDDATLIKMMKVYFPKNKSKTDNAIQWISNQFKSVKDNPGLLHKYFESTDAVANMLGVDGNDLRNCRKYRYLNFDITSKLIDWAVDNDKDLAPDGMSSMTKLCLRCGFVLREDVDKMFNNTTVVVGMAGTGKSYRLIEDVNKVFMKGGQQRFLIVAPTGTAARNLNDKLNNSNHNILNKYCIDHKIINTIDYWYIRNSNTGYEEELFDGERHERLDYIFVDEASMVGCNNLYKKIRRMMDDQTKLFLYGDTNQLPPVKDESVLNRALDNENTEIIRLEKQWRSDDSIIELANLVLVDHNCALDPIENPDMILCYKNETVDKINEAMRQDPDYLCEGEPVMCLSNKYCYKRVGASNGSMGIVQADGSVLFEQCTESVKIDNLEDVRLAYANTIHKSQGHEWPRIGIVNDFPKDFDYRLLYTAITRARDEVGIYEHFKETGEFK